MPRLLSGSMIVEKNRVESDHPWTMLFQVDIAGAPGPLRLAAYPEPIAFHGQVFQSFVVDVDDLETPTSMSLVNWRVTKQNVDQQLVALFETYWFNVVDPDWQVRQWEIDVTMPDETAFESANIFSVQQATTDFYVASFDLVGEGISLGTVIPKRRYTASMGWPGLPRPGQ
jgi:hypothetical protein